MFSTMTCIILGSITSVEISKMGSAIAWNTIEPYGLSDGVETVKLVVNF